MWVLGNRSENLIATGYIALLYHFLFMERTGILQIIIIDIHITDRALIRTIPTEYSGVYGSTIPGKWLHLMGVENGTILAINFFWWYRFVSLTPCHSGVYGSTSGW